MPSNPLKIAQNTTYLTTAYIVQKIFSFLYFILIARMIGVGDIGKYVFALSFTSIFGIFIDLGLSQVLTREGAKDGSKIKNYLGDIISVKAVLSILTYAAVVIAINLLNKEPLVKELVYLAGVIMILDSFYLSFYAAFRAHQNLKYEALGMIIGQVIIFTSGLTVLFLKLPLIFLIGAILCGSVFNFIYAITLMKRKLKIDFALHFDKEDLKLLFKIALPFALAGIFARVYGYIDAVLLSTMAGDKAVGWYSAGYKITFALQFIPMAFAAAIFPAMSNYFVTNKELLAKTLEKSIYYLLLIALPITFGVATLAKEIIVAMYGPAYLPTAFALQILIFNLAFNFLSFPLGSLLNACNKQVTNTVIMGITMVVSILSNLILIKAFGSQAYMGSSIAIIISSLTLFSLSLYYAGKIVKYNKKFLIIGALKVLAASVIMSIVITALKSTFHFMILIPIGGLVYLSILFLLRGFDIREIKDLFFSLVRRNSKTVYEENTISNN